MEAGGLFDYLAQSAPRRLRRAEALAVHAALLSGGRVGTVVLKRHSAAAARVVEQHTERIHVRRGRAFAPPEQLRRGEFHLFGAEILAASLADGDAAVVPDADVGRVYPAAVTVKPGARLQLCAQRGAQLAQGLAVKLCYLIPQGLGGVVYIYAHRLTSLWSISIMLTHQNLLVNFGLSKNVPQRNFLTSLIRRAFCFHQNAALLQKSLIHQDFWTADYWI